jgi:hypothetical protein
MWSPPKFHRRGSSLWAEIVGKIFMEEVEFEGVLEEYLHQMLSQVFINVTMYPQCNNAIIKREEIKKNQCPPPPKKEI